MSLGIYNTRDFVEYKDLTSDIKESLIRIIFTSPGERVGNPEFGCNLRALLFEPDFVFLDEVKYTIEKAVSAYETRVVLQSLDIEKVTFNEYKVFLNFKYLVNNQIITIDQSVIV